MESIETGGQQIFADLPTLTIWRAVRLQRSDDEFRAPRPFRGRHPFFLGRKYGSPEALRKAVARLSAKSTPPLVWWDARRSCQDEALRVGLIAPSGADKCPDIRVTFSFPLPRRQTT